ncbi:hypothetical protein COJ46_23045 [Bacillus sp. AFS077874]|uniref:hypothetical protein n=1 Tax=unclassified Bacillus (in: firmicutes) TaxID=185979 RepID=UPI000BECD1A1|nr:MULTISPECIES: hypothetical protein [unclassified Bacillus (in: firmicutes)]PEC49034.1 hypothetical protein CON00_12285 [Bacillus sp. AFS096315]PFM74703.1 hypothetical protein COJ46_23045 [Bacillus sp. AFS077874]
MTAELITTEYLNEQLDNIYKMLEESIVEKNANASFFALGQANAISFLLNNGKPDNDPRYVSLNRMVTLAFEPELLPVSHNNENKA